MQKLRKLHTSAGALANKQCLCRQVQGFKQRGLHRCDFTGGKGQVGDTIKQQLGRGEYAAVGKTTMFWAALGSVLLWLAGEVAFTGFSCPC